MSGNGFGTQVIFATSGISQSLVPGYVTSFSLTKQSEMKEVTDSNDNYLNVNFPKQKKVLTTTILFNNSGSTFSLPAPGTTTATITVPWSGDVSGSWGVTKSSVKASNDSYVEADVEITQWITSTGTLP